MLKPGMKVKLIKPKTNLQQWPPHLDKEIGKTYKVIKVIGELSEHLLNKYPNLKGEVLVLVEGVIGYFIEDWLQPVLDNGKVSCPLCDWPAVVNFNLVLCENEKCQNGKGYGHNGE